MIVALGLRPGLLKAAVGRGIQSEPSRRGGDRRRRTRAVHRAGDAGTTGAYR